MFGSVFGSKIERFPLNAGCVNVASKVCSILTDLLLNSVDEDFEE
jgi:hypothetical protein